MSEATNYCSIIKERFALDISQYDSSFLKSTIQSRMISLGYAEEADYLLYLCNSENETFSLVDVLTNSYSEFFRSPITFAYLEQSIIPKLFGQNAKESPHEIRVWSAGCAAGQEPYSLAMLFNEFKDSRSNDFGYRIFATDCSAKQLEMAQKGVYDLKTVKNTRIGFCDKYFSRDESSFTLNEKIKEQVHFSCFNLMDQDSSAPPASVYGDFDLVMCSNVLFYYNDKHQNIILNKIGRSLKKNGVFITGEAESCIVNSFGGFKKYLDPGIFVKN